MQDSSEYHLSIKKMQGKSLHFVFELFAEIGGDKLSQRIGCANLIGTFSNDGDFGTLSDTHGENAQQALCVHASVILFDPDAALKLVCLLDEKGGRSCVEAHLVINNRSLDIHRDTPLSLNLKKNFSSYTILYQK